MRLFPASGSTKGPADLFTGDVYFAVILQGETPSRVQMNAVHFTPGTRSAWHAHAVGQYLHITEGFALIQERDDTIHVLRSGDTVYTAAGVWHWHGATKDHFMTHLAIWEAPENVPETEWGDHVTDEEYAQQPEIHA